MATTAADRVYNFSPGPAVLPTPVLERIQDEMLALPGVGASVLEISHRGKVFVDILESANSNLRALLKLPKSYQVLFLQGGSRLQFSMVPMNLLRGQSAPAQYLLTGSWGQKAREEAVKEGKVEIAWDGKPHNYDRLPPAAELKINPQAAYVHFTSNETIEGVQFLDEPDAAGAPLVCDASSDFLCRPLPMDRYGLLYACAQKNAGPAGVTVVIIREDLLERSREDLPGYLSYKNHAEENSLYNTPPTFAVYVLNLVCEWLLNDVGGLDKMLQRNREKSKLLYDVLDGSDGFYRGHAQRESRSLMNVTFRLPDEAAEKKFLAGAEARGLTALKGHRSVGGIRASI
ncbi:MAG: 3-phosphoserine/phosphohydroxythreonine transaminase, partial [Planctomycetes bacterium]|nr:3-phosphoserine/phosphohydroxythreonine transaminase [Planctomycetota bacterium]